MSSEQDASREGPRTYRAFLSYSRSDDRLAGWLHRALEAYRTSSRLVGAQKGERARGLSPIFRDRTDLSSGGDLTGRIKQALADSDALIVLCSPAAGQSVWVNAEVEAYIELGRKDRIFPVIAAGEPDSGDPASECLPPALRGLGLLAADLRQVRRADGRVIGDGREGGKLKLISGLLGVTLDALMHRERQRQRMIVALSTFASTVFLILAVAAVGLGYVAYRNGQEATDTLNKFFAANGWAALQRQDNYLAARYALAGMQIAPNNADAYRALLGAAYSASAELSQFNVGSAESATVSPDGRRVIVVGWGPSKLAVTPSAGSAVLWDAQNGRPGLAIGPYPGLADVALSKDGTRIIALADMLNTDMRVKMFDARSGALLRVFDAPGAKSNLEAISPADDVVATNNDRYQVILWSATTGDRIATLDADASVAAFSPDGHQIVTAGGTGGSANVWDVQTGRLIMTLAGATGDAVAYSPDGRFILTTTGNTGQVWDARSGQLIAPLTGHEQRIVTAAFSPDSTRIVTASDDGTARIWDTFDGRNIATLKASPLGLWGAGFTSDGRRAVTTGGGDQGVATIWDVSRLTESWRDLAADACHRLLGQAGRHFTALEISADPLLRSKWPDPNRDVCQGVG